MRFIISLFSCQLHWHGEREEDGKERNRKLYFPIYSFFFLAESISHLLVCRKPTPSGQEPLVKYCRRTDDKTSDWADRRPSGWRTYNSERLLETDPGLWRFSCGQTLACYIIDNVSYKRPDPFPSKTLIFQMMVLNYLINLLWSSNMINMRSNTTKSTRQCKREWKQMNSKRTSSFDC